MEVSGAGGDVWSDWCLWSCCCILDHQSDQQHRLLSLQVGFHLGIEMINSSSYFFRGFVHFGAGLTVGFSCLISGYAIGVLGDAGVRATSEQPNLFVRMTLILIFAETLGLYGLMIGVYMYTKN